MNPENSPDNNLIFNEDISYDNTSQSTSQNTSQDTSQNIPQDTRVKKQRSAIHNYFTIDEENSKYNCNHCNKSYKIAKDGSTSNLWKHIKNTHNGLLLENQITDAMNRLEISEQLVCIYNILICLFILYNKLLN
jgi:transposase-like protein